MIAIAGDMKIEDIALLRHALRTLSADRSSAENLPGSTGDRARGFCQFYGNFINKSRKRLSISSSLRRCASEREIQNTVKTRKLCATRVASIGAVAMDAPLRQRRPREWFQSSFE